MGERVLLLDADESRGARLCRGLELHGFSPTPMRSLVAVLDALRESETAAVVVSLPDAGAIEACRRIREAMPQVPVVVVAREASVVRAVDALRAGAADYVDEHSGADPVPVVVERVLERAALRRHVKNLRTTESEGPPAGPLIGASPAIEEVRRRIERIAGSDGAVLVTGASGTGKGLVARMVHESSRRQHGPFVPIDCAALPEQLVESELFGHAKGAFTGATGARIGLLAQANGGTVFLDEITSMPLGTQAKLLRALQEKAVRPIGDVKEVSFDARVISATNRDLEACVGSGEFREDLFFRLNVLSIHLPLLRERDRDVLLLAQHYIDRFSAAGAKRVVGMTPGAARVLLSYDWPGNVRELANCIEAAVLNAHYDHITARELPLDGAGAPPPGEPEPSTTPAALVPLESLERDHIDEVLRSVGGNRSRAAKILGLDRKTLWRKLKQNG